MSKPNLPGANRNAQWFGDTYPGSPIDANCVVLHTTETNDWPSYGGGSSAPQLTAKPDISRKRLVKRQHLRMDRSARALQNDSGGVETNTLNCIQIELVGCCDPAIERIWRSWGLHRNVDYIFWPEAPRWARRELGRLLAQLHRRYGVRLDGPSEWRQTGSWGESAPQRFSFAQWRGFYGVCGHQHVPENDHWDPGGIRFASVMRFAKRSGGGDDPKPQSEAAESAPADVGPTLRERAKGGNPKGRVDRGRAIIRIASNHAKNAVRRARLRDWLRSGPKR